MPTPRELTRKVGFLSASILRERAVPKVGTIRLYEAEYENGYYFEVWFRPAGWEDWREGSDGWRCLDDNVVWCGATDDNAEGLFAETMDWCGVAAPPRRWA